MSTDVPEEVPLETPASRETTGHPLTERRYRARAYRDGELVGDDVELTVRTDTRLGLAPRERRCLTARFPERLHPALRTELTGLVRRRGPIAARAAERMQPVEIIVDDPSLGRQQIIGCIQPPQLRHGALHKIEFGLREQPA
ncbi:MAG: hypothetical protein ACR2H2_02795 [Solirubrobacteraceae bacterium]